MNDIQQRKKEWRWPLRRRVAQRWHCQLNRLHCATGRGRLTWWLNCKAGELWIPWWMDEGRHRYDYRSQWKQP